MLIHFKVEHHLNALTGAAEVVHICRRQHIGLAQNDRVSFPPTEKLAEGSQHLVILFGFGNRCSLGGNHEGNGIHAKARNSELQPKAHDLEDFRLHLRIGGVQVGLKVVKAMEVIFLRDIVTGPGCLLDPWKDHAGGSVLGLLL